MLKFLQNIGEYFTSKTFDEEFTAKVLAKTVYPAEEVKEFNKRISPLKPDQTCLTFWNSITNVMEMQITAEYTTQRSIKVSNL